MCELRWWLAVFGWLFVGCGGVVVLSWCGGWWWSVLLLCWVCSGVVWVCWVFKVVWWVGFWINVALILFLQSSPVKFFIFSIRCVQSNLHSSLLLHHKPYMI